MNWKKGRGKLGVFQPLLGKWITNEGGNSQSNPQCIRTFKSVLNHKYIELKAEWQLTGSVYEDITFIGVNSDKDISFWSFTSYGKESKGTIADVSDIHPEAIGFEAMMPAGLARQAYWPDEENGFHWAVESKNKKGWNRFVHHHYTAYQAK
jgi:hypothetical protein